VEDVDKGAISENLGAGVDSRLGEKTANAAARNGSRWEEAYRTPAHGMIATFNNTHTKPGWDEPRLPSRSPAEIRFQGRQKGRQ
jgi:hypothetical protein